MCQALSTLLGHATCFFEVAFSLVGETDSKQITTIHYNKCHGTEKHRMLGKLVTVPFFLG